MTPDSGAADDGKRFVALHVPLSGYYIKREECEERERSAPTPDSGAADFSIFLHFEPTSFERFFGYG